MKVYGMLGLAAKKGSAVSGREACERAIKSGVAGLLVLAGDCAANTKKELYRIADGSNVDGVVFGACSELGRRIGKKKRSAVVVTDVNLARGILLLLGIAVNEYGGVKFG
jgi:ribosomal protein L7Ae-like RNA K-turn-binding protein